MNLLEHHSLVDFPLPIMAFEMSLNSPEIGIAAQSTYTDPLTAKIVVGSLWAFALTSILLTVGIMSSSTVLGAIAVAIVGVFLARLAIRYAQRQISVIKPAQAKTELKTLLNRHFPDEAEKTAMAYIVGQMAAKEFPDSEWVKRARSQHAVKATDSLDFIVELLAHEPKLWEASMAHLYALHKMRAEELIAEFEASELANTAEPV